MDPLSITASVAGLIALGGTMIALCEKLYHTAKKLRSAKKEISKFARDIELFADIITLACYFLQEYSPKELQSPVLQYLRKKKILGRLNDQAENMFDDIEEISPNLLKLTPNMSFFKRFRWVQSKLEIKAMGPVMEGIKTSFTLVLLMVRLEPLFGLRTERSLEEIKLLKRQISSHLEYAEFLRSQPTERGIFQSSQEHDPSHNLLLETIEHMADTMVETDTVPPIRRRSRHSSNSSSGQNSGNITQTHSPRRPLDNNSVANLRPSPMLLAPAQTRELSPIVLSTNSSPREVVDQQFDAVLPSVEATAEPTNTNNQPRMGDDYVAVQPRNKLTLDLSKDYESIDGYLASSDGSKRMSFKHLTAILYSDFEDNIISQAFAVELGLVIQDLDPDEAVRLSEISFGPSEQLVPKIGNVTLTWSRGESSHRRNFPVHCSVYEFSIRPLILGRPFIEKRRHYWPDYRDWDRRGSAGVEVGEGVSREGQQNGDSSVNISPTSSEESERSPRLRRIDRRLNEGEDEY